MLKKGLIIVGIIAVVGMVSACSGTDTLSQRNWGKSYETAAYNQMLNPDADETLKPVDSLDGQAAKNVHKRYRESFKTKEETQAPVSLINFGSKR
jgi:hypothetical protein